ncbi:MAG: translation initiation factor IF-3 [Acidimicrobiaceae bacterium]|nr:translation initiation factor IF-3 [Acidimicrobiaceae bacterium]MCO4832830.1 translation initiation factor IF-3 [Acidimicrobiaceae bacterium]HAY68227.1 translation initiation factor IF-3 [Acidimicrobiaceae bacterium]
MNDKIRAREVRLVGADGEQIGIVSLPNALTRAQQAGLDLVEVADKANPPVCKIMDHGKAVYEAKQRDKASRKKSTTVQVKEMKYRPKIGVGDFDTKTRKVKQFLAEGNRVKITIMFRGREMQHPELGRKILDQVAEAADSIAKVEIYPKLDGRNMVMVMVPDREKQAAAAKVAKDEAAAAKAEAAAAVAAATEAASPPDVTIEHDDITEEE